MGHTTTKVAAHYTQFLIYDHLFISIAYMLVRTSSDAQKTAQKQQIDTQL